MKTASSPLVLGLSLMAFAVPLQAQDPYAAARTPFAELIAGRQYKQGYPAGGKSRKMLVRDFLKFPKTGDPTGFNDIHHGDKLASAVDLAVAGRLASTSPAELAALQVIAWEALEAHAEGYILAGNKDLLESLRASFPNLGGSALDADTRPRPIDLNAEYVGTQARKLVYARHYFFEPVREILTFLAEDPSGLLRASDTDYANVGMYHYTQFDDPDQLALPKASGFNDTNFPDEPLIVGAAVQVASAQGAEVRATAGAAATIGLQASGQTGTIVDGPVRDRIAAVPDTPRPSYTWWKVDFVTGPDGWVIMDHIASSSAANSNGQPSQTAGALYGNALERWGMAAYSFADQLWRAAFMRNTAKNPTSTPGVYGGANNAAEEAEFTEMLSVAETTLHSSIHGQFLATLPLAATLSEADYQQSRIDHARVSTTQAIDLFQRVRAQEKPKKTALVTAWTPADIQNQVSRLKDAYAEARRWYSGPTGDANLPHSVEQSLARQEDAETTNANNRIQLRNQYETQLLNLTGLNPSNYNGLAEAQDRQDYLQAIEDKYTALMSQPSGAAVASDGSQMTISALRLRAAIFECEAAYNQLKAYPERIRVELQRNGEVNAAIQFGTMLIAVMDQAIAIAGALNVSVFTGFPSSGVNISTNNQAIIQAQLAIPRALAASNQQVQINAANSRATVSNLLIDQLLAYDSVTRAKLQSDIAGAELRGLYEQAKRLAQDHFFFQDVTNALWYADPTLAFKAEAVEEKYEEATQVARGEAYKLARILEAAWAEKFSNPVTTGGSPAQLIALSNAGADNYFEAESVFAAPNHLDVLTFYATLKGWDTQLRQNTYRGAPDATVRDVNSFGFVPLSYRQDILGLRDYKYSPASLRYELDQALRARNIREFRAILVGLAENDPKNQAPLNLGRLRLDFKLRYDHNRLVSDVSGNLADPTTVVRRNSPSGYDLFWNHRLRRFGVKLVGSNIYPENNGYVTSTFEWYGKLERVSKLQDSPLATRGFTDYFDTPSYLDDPDKRTGSGIPMFGGNIDMAFGTTSIVDSPNPPANSLAMLQTDIPLFCEKVILIIPKANGLKIEQLDDIELYMKMQTGSPDAFGLPDANTF